MKVVVIYGLLITICIMAWILAAHAMVPDPNSSVHKLGAAVFFNLVEVAGIFLGIRAQQRANGGEITFKQGVNTGLGIALVYGITACIFFGVEIFAVGAKLMASEPGTPAPPVIGAFIGLFLSAVVLGLIYSAIISFVLAKRKSQDE